MHSCFRFMNVNTCFSHVVNAHWLLLVSKMARSFTFLEWTRACWENDMYCFLSRLLVHWNDSFLLPTCVCYTFLILKGHCLILGTFGFLLFSKIKSHKTLNYLFTLDCHFANSRYLNIVVHAPIDKSKITSREKDNTQGIKYFKQQYYKYQEKNIIF